MRYTMPTDDSSAAVECGCEYPHGHDFEPPFETCTCKPDCFHVVPLNLERILQGYEEDAWEADDDPIYPPEEDADDEGQMLGIDR